VSILLAGAAPTRAQSSPREVMNGAELRLALQKLRVLGSVLYVAAHPDDENTSLITYLSRGRKVRVGYLAMTRGSGGQNLIGSETGEALGAIRTQELLAARSIDGAEQFFTRAIDFGYSKTAEETMEIWGRDDVLSDIVWVIRSFRPDVIVTRFPPDGRGGHGHHQASAILAKEAFTAAADPTRFPDQLKSVRPWQAKRILWNAFRVDPATRDAALPKLLTIDLGEYDPLLGKSYAELSAASRSMHKSQGFGAAERRGPVPNYLEWLDGAPAAADLLEGVTTGWPRIPGGNKVDALLADAERAFDPTAPEKIVPTLVRARAMIARLGDDPWIALKLRDLDEVIRSCAGLWMEAIAERAYALPGASIPVSISVMRRAALPVTLAGIEMPPGSTLRAAADSTTSLVDGPLERNLPLDATATVPIAASAERSHPFWLREPPGPGSYRIADATLRGAAENPPALTVRVDLLIEGTRISYAVPVLYRWTDRVAGERYRPLEIVPPVTLRFDRKVYLFPDARPRDVRVAVETPGPGATGTVRLQLPGGWSASPAETTVSVPEAGGSVGLRFRVTPGGATGSESISASMEVAGTRYGRARIVIDYPHLPVMTLFPPAQAHLVRADLKTAGTNIGYVMGSGDDIPQALEEMGCRVTLLTDDEIESAPLGGYDAIVVGIRAYNTRPRLRTLQERLLGYASNGGTLVVQYNTVEADLQNRLGPYPFELSRDRVTVEGAPVRVSKADHPLLRRPNRIGASDFEGWVQERGLYFANPFDAKYDTLFSINDPGEEPMVGGLLYARYGKGAYIYTGLSWFRQLPAGVPGAFRIFANLIGGAKG
jgi:LmbE family N-acetylglucosaminyl deacetylase